MNAILKSLAAIALAATFVTSAPAQDSKTINFGIISTESQSNLRPKWEPYLKAMGEKTGMEIKPFFASDYAGVIEGMRFGKVDVAWHGNKSAMEAVDRANGEVFAQTVRADGSPGYWSVVIVPADSSLKSIDDLLVCDRSRDFGMGDVNSASGYLVPMTFIFSAKGVDPRKCFGSVINANHETNVMAVANGQVDAATNNTESLGLIQKNRPEVFAKIREIWRSPLIPLDPIVWRKDLPDETKAKVKDFFLTFGTEQSKGDVAAENKILADLDWAPFKGSTNDQLLPIRVMEVTRKMSEIQADATLSGEEKSAQSTELTARKAELEAQMAAASKN